MEDYQLRVIEERDQLISSIDKLTAFLDNTYEELSWKDKELLRDQREAMWAYEEALSRRIESFPASSGRDGSVTDAEDGIKWDHSSEISQGKFREKNVKLLLSPFDQKWAFVVESRTEVNGFDTFTTAKEALERHLGTGSERLEQRFKKELKDLLRKHKARLETDPYYSDNRNRPCVFVEFPAQYDLDGILQVGSQQFNLGGLIDGKE